MRVGVVVCLSQALALMPSDAMVCLITFGAMCMLHEIADASEYNKVHVFHGSRELSSSSVSCPQPAGLNDVHYGSLVTVSFHLMQRLCQSLLVLCRFNSNWDFPPGPPTQCPDKAAPEPATRCCSPQLLVSFSPLESARPKYLSFWNLSPRTTGRSLQTQGAPSMHSSQHGFRGHSLGFGACWR